VTVGPVDVVIIEFPDNNFSGEIFPAVRDLVAAGTIRIIDALLIGKDAEGAVVKLEIAGVDAALEPAFVELDVEFDRGLLGDDDLEMVADALAPNSSALLLAWENTWAGPVVRAIQNANGRLVDRVHIPREVVLESLAAAGIDA
jgi:uncharacterized membrane protein